MPQSDITGALDLPFAEQVEFLRKKLDLPTQRWDDLWKAGHDRAFVVAGAIKADLLADLHGAVQKAIDSGTTLETFRKDFRAIVEKHGWHGWTGEGTKTGEAWRTRIIYETNLRASYAAGRYAQLTDPELPARRPYWKYIHSESVLHPRPQHLAWDGLVLKHDHTFWQTHYPPNGWGCGCSVVAVRAPNEDDRREPPAGWDAIDAKTGEFPGLDKGWGYAPGASVSDELRKIVAEKLTKLPAPLGADYGFSLLAETIAPGFAGFFHNAYTNRLRPEGKWMVVGALTPLWVQKTTAAGVAPVSAEIALRDVDVSHTFRDAKANQLSPEWFSRLPMHLKEPQAVILDTTHANEPALLLLFDAPGDAKKLVARVNYQIRKVGTMNVVSTGQTVDLAGITSEIGKGYTLIDGSL